jgi:[ribosomal protein S18]-alanine N-acetyltransferase
MTTPPASAALPSTFAFVPMTAAYARALLAWHYDPPYDVYNADPDMAEADIAESFLNPAYHYYAVLDAQGVLIAYRCFGEDARVPGGDYSADALDMGGGLRPDLTGRRLGPQIMRAAMTFARAHFAPRAFRTTVAAWNTRAQRACSKVGYQPLAAFHTPQGAPYVIMLRDAIEDGMME